MERREKHRRVRLVGRRRFCYARHIPERRSGSDRRQLTRRKGGSHGKAQ